MDIQLYVHSIFKCSTTYSQQQCDILSSSDDTWVSTGWVCRLQGWKCKCYFIIYFTYLQAWSYSRRALTDLWWIKFLLKSVERRVKTPSRQAFTVVLCFFLSVSTPQFWCYWCYSSHTNLWRSHNYIFQTSSHSPQWSSHLNPSP